MEHFPSRAPVQARSTLEAPIQYTTYELDRFLNQNRRSHKRSPLQGTIISLLIAQSAGKLEAYLGASSAEQNLSPWPGGQMPVTQPVANRAGYKLLEAISSFNIRLRAGDHALDLGAAPGAWTTFLCQRGLRVTAVAPTPLYPWLMQDEKVIYRPELAEKFLNTCQTTFDLIVNDMKLDARDSARLMVDYARHLRSEGIAIMTLKLRSRSLAKTIDHALRILRKEYKIIRIRQLVSNRQEVTLFLRLKS